MKVGGPSGPVGDNFWWPGPNLGGPDQISEIQSLPFEQIWRIVFSKVLFLFISLLMLHVYKI